jgi:sulfur-oxidizing protein SoxA
VRAEPLPLGSQTYIDLELYLSARANGLAMESPAIRR